MGAVVRQRLVEGGATSEATWLPWLASRVQNATAPTVPTPSHGRLVVVSPHPDDEVLGCGGLLAMHAAAGHDSLVVAVTDGEASHRPLHEPTAAALAATRRAESNEGLLRLAPAVGAPLRLNLPDGGVAHSESRLVGLLASILRRGDTVVAPWRFDGHPDHDASGRAAVRACAQVGSQLLEMPIWMWHWATPGDARVPWRRLAALHLPEWASLQKRSALQAHTSQLLPRSASMSPVLDASIVARSQRLHEYFFVS